MIASPGDESLYTNVPVGKTIGMTMDRVDQDPAVGTSLDRPEGKSLEATQSMYNGTHPDGRMFKQVDGVALAFPLAVLCANIYLGTVEQKVFVDMCLKPSVNCKYADNIFRYIY